MRSRTRSTRFRTRGLASPSGSSAGACLKRTAKRSTMVRLLPVVGHDLVEMHVPVRRGADAYGVFGVEVPGTFAAEIVCFPY